MRRPDGKTLPAILEENTAVHLADTRLTKEEKEELQEAGCSLGTGDRAMQKANLDRYCLLYTSGRAYAGYNVGSVGLMLRLMEEAAKA